MRVFSIFEFAPAQRSGKRHSRNMLIIIIVIISKLQTSKLIGPHLFGLPDGGLSLNVDLQSQVANEIASQTVNKIKMDECKHTKLESLIVF